MIVFKHWMGLTVIIVKGPPPLDKDRVLTTLEVDSLLGFDSAIYVEQDDVYVVWEESLEGCKAFKWLAERPVEVEIIEQSFHAIKFKFINRNDEMLFRLTFVVE